MFKGHADLYNIFNIILTVIIIGGPKTDKTASILHYIKRNKIKKQCYVIRQENIVYTFFYKIIFFKYKTRQIKTTEIRK